MRLLCDLARFIPVCKIILFTFECCADETGYFGYKPGITGYCLFKWVNCSLLIETC